MKFTINHARALTGNDISVAVEADEGKAIQSVLTSLDGLQLANDILPVPSDSYDRLFSGAGHASPNKEHTLVVSAALNDGTVHSSTSKWTDLN